MEFLKKIIMDNDRYVMSVSAGEIAQQNMITVRNNNQ